MVLPSVYTLNEMNIAAEPTRDYCFDIRELHKALPTTFRKFILRPAFLHGSIRIDRDDALAYSESD